MQTNLSGARIQWPHIFWTNLVRPAPCPIHPILPHQTELAYNVGNGLITIKQGQVTHSAVTESLAPCSAAIFCPAVANYHAVLLNSCCVIPFNAYSSWFMDLINEINKEDVFLPQRPLLNTIKWCGPICFYVPLIPLCRLHWCIIINCVNNKTNICHMLTSVTVNQSSGKWDDYVTLLTDSGASFRFAIYFVG